MALSLGSPPPDVIRRRFSVEPGLSSIPKDGGHPADWPSSHNSAGRRVKFIRQAAAGARTPQFARDGSVAILHLRGAARPVRSFVATLRPAAGRLPRAAARGVSEDSMKKSLMLISRAGDRPWPRRLRLYARAAGGQRRGARRRDRRGHRRAGFGPRRRRGRGRRAGRRGGRHHRRQYRAPAAAAPRRCAEFDLRRYGGRHCVAWYDLTDHSVPSRRPIRGRLFDSARSP